MIPIARVTSIKLNAPFLSGERENRGELAGLLKGRSVHTSSLHYPRSRALSKELLQLFSGDMDKTPTFPVAKPRRMPGGELRDIPGFRVPAGAFAFTPPGRVQPQTRDHRESVAVAGCKR